MRTRRSVPPVLSCASLEAVGEGPARIGGTVRRLTFVPDGGEGQLVATLADGGAELDVRVPRIHARDWAPGSVVVAEGAMRGPAFVVRAYLPRPAEDGAGVWIEVAPLFSRTG
jgi:hypothetical protein